MTPCLKRAVVTVALLATSAVVSAQEGPVLSADEIVQKLSDGAVAKAYNPSYKPDPVTGRCRGDEWEGGARVGDKLVVVPRIGPADIRLDLPFGFDRHHLSTREQAQLEQLAIALRSPSLAAARFSLTGHADASGPAEHNRRLSCARAMTVREFLKSRGVDAARLGTFGLGADELKDLSQPASAINRRVEIRNVGLASGQ